MTPNPVYSIIAILILATDVFVVVFVPLADADAWLIFSFCACVLALIMQDYENAKWIKRHTHKK